MSEVKFENSKVQVIGENGDRWVSAVTHPIAPGIAITMCNFGTFEVTHIASGSRMSGGHERFGEAAIAFADWASIGIKYNIEWPEFDAKEFFKTHSQDPVPFEGATTTDNKEGKKPMNIGMWINCLPLSDLGYPWEDEHPLDTAMDKIESLMSKEPS